MSFILEDQGNGFYSPIMMISDPNGLLMFQWRESFWDIEYARSRLDEIEWTMEDLGPAFNPEEYGWHQKNF